MAPVMTTGWRGISNRRRKSATSGRGMEGTVASSGMRFSFELERGVEARPQQFRQPRGVRGAEHRYVIAGRALDLHALRGQGLPAQRVVPKQFLGRGWIV